MTLATVGCGLNSIRGEGSLRKGRSTASTNYPNYPNEAAPVEIIEREVSYEISGAFYEVYNEMGYGLAESHYSQAMFIVMTERGLKVECEVPIDVIFRGHFLGRHRMDMLVEGRIVIENKATEKLAEAHYRQLRTYVRAAKLELGLLLHFGPRPTIHRELAGRGHSRSLPDSRHSGNSYSQSPHNTHPRDL